MDISGFASEGTSDNEGKYFIENLRPGRYFVLAIKYGYRPKVKIVRVKQGHTTIVNFELIKLRIQEEISTYNEILKAIKEQQENQEVQELSINPEFEAHIALYLSQQNIEELPFIEDQEPITLILTPNKKALSYQEELTIDISSNNENLAGINLKVDYDQTKLLLTNQEPLFIIGTKTLKLVFKAISEDLDTTIKIIPISARNTNNREIQAYGCKITITTAIPETQLLQSYPNPANQGCYIPFRLSNDTNVSLEAYNIIGQKVRTIELGQKTKGSYIQENKAIFWDLRNDSQQKVSKGLYFYKIKAGEFKAIKSMIVK
ncbi:TPA: hypothetical protein DCX16_02720 [bacterium]|nr:hypothetical protein [bacterium]